MNLIEKIRNSEDITIDFVGDSITYGLNYCRPEETYVAKFASLIAARLENYSVYRYDGIVSDELLPIQEFDGPITVSYKENAAKIDIIRNGIGGNNVLRAFDRIDDFTGTLANGKRPDITFMMFGVNDALISNPQRYQTPEQFFRNYKRLIDEVKKRNPDTFIIIMNATYNDQSVSEHCKKTEELAKSEGIPYIDMHRLWMEHYDAEACHNGQGDWLANDWDACHPTPKAAHIMAQKICDEFLNIISRS
ncbi:MAG: SGNH/GDSL hydrolase family protein [Clostridia bacterium]|nr:SGNH/GDSL hydrolase family protein [Clostridia bacterium]